MKLVSLGDSITAAIYVSDADSYCKLFADVIGYTHVNAGVSGDTSAQMLARLSADVIAQAPQICTVMAGTNDMANAVAADTLNTTMITTYIANMGSIIDGLIGAGIKPIVVSPMLSRNVRETARWPDAIRALRDLCVTKNVEYVPLNETMLNDYRSASSATYLAWFMSTPGTGDGTDIYHPAAAGHARINALLSRYSTIPLGPSGPDTAHVGTVLSATLTGNFGNINGQTIRAHIAASSLTIPTNGVSWMRVKLRAHVDEPTAVNKMYLGPITSGVAASALYPVKVAGAASFTVPAAGFAWSDWIPFAWNKTSGLIFSMYDNGGTSVDKIAANASLTGAGTALKSGDDAATLSPTGFTDYSGYLSFVEAIETDGF